MRGGVGCGFVDEREHCGFAVGAHAEGLCQGKIYWVVAGVARDVMDVLLAPGGDFFDGVEVLPEPRAVADPMLFPDFDGGDGRAVALGFLGVVEPAGFVVYGGESSGDAETDAAVVDCVLKVFREGEELKALVYPGRRASEVAGGGAQAFGGLENVVDLVRFFQRREVGADVVLIESGNKGICVGGVDTAVQRGPVEDAGGDESAVAPDDFPSPIR